MAFMDQFNQASAQRQPQMEMLASKFNSVKQAANNDASGFINYLAKVNPKFAQLVQDVQNKTPEQAFAELGLDYSKFSWML